MIIPTPIDQIVFEKTVENIVPASAPIAATAPSSIKSVPNGTNPTSNATGSGLNVFEILIIGVLIIIVVTGITYLARKNYKEKRTYV